LKLSVIEVKGQRGNLISAQNMKMNANTVMDAISAADMGSMPDRSVLEAISRMPGVAIERFAAADDPDHFGVEGGGVLIRGLCHVRSEFNGRDTFSADSGRGLSFEDVSPELMG
jgi:iron complex outermembrane receptor protein